MRTRIDNQIVIFTGCDHKLFASCVDLITSIKRASNEVPRIRVLDVGMQSSQAEQVAGLVESVITPGWDLGGGLGLPDWYRAMTARSFLPNYIDDAEIIAWIDCDAWVQDWHPVESLICAARHGELAIVEEQLGKGFVVDVPTGFGTFQRMGVKAETVQANIRKCYEQCYGGDIAAAFGDLPAFNGGVFALRADSPSWSIWQQNFAEGLARFHSDRLVDQQSLTIGIRQGRIPVALQPPEANFICGFELPWFSPDRRLFAIPEVESRRIGVIHLHDTKSFPLLSIPCFPNGELRQMPLSYSAYQTFLANGGHGAGQSDFQQTQMRVGSGVVGTANPDPDDPASWGSVSRNAPCPCGSGRRFKHCHGKLS